MNSRKDKSTSEKDQPSPLIKAISEWATLLEQFSKIVAYIAIPIVLAFGGWSIQGAIARQSVNKDYVQLATGILTAPKDSVDPELRNWAVDLINQNSPLPFSNEAISKLKSGDASFPEITAPGYCSLGELKAPLVIFSTDTATVGQGVKITVRSDWSSCFRTMRLIIDDKFVYESANVEFTYDWDTTIESPGNHTIIAEVAGIGDTNWQNSAKIIVTYILK